MEGMEDKKVLARLGSLNVRQWPWLRHSRDQKWSERQEAEELWHLSDGWPAGPTFNTGKLGLKLRHPAQLQSASRPGQECSVCLVATHWDRWVQGSVYYYSHFWKDFEDLGRFLRYFATFIMTMRLTNKTLEPAGVISTYINPVISSSNMRILSI